MFYHQNDLVKSSDSTFDTKTIWLWTVNSKYYVEKLEARKASYIAHNRQKKKGKILESMKGASLEFTQKLVSHIWFGIFSNQWLKNFYFINIWFIFFRISSLQDGVDWTSEQKMFGLHGLSKVKRLVLGIFVLLVVDLIWVASSELTEVNEYIKRILVKNRPISLLCVKIFKEL